MITDMRYDFVEDVSKKNDVISIPISPSLHFAASVWTAPVGNSLGGARVKSLEHALKIIGTNWPSGQLWLVSGHKAIQPDTRITRHHGLWKSLQKAGVVLPNGHFIRESLHKVEDGIRVFGAVHFDYSELGLVPDVMRASQAAIVFMPEPEGTRVVSLLVERGWALVNTNPPEEIIETVCAESGLVIDLYGEFDDPEVSVVAIGRKEVLVNL